MGLALKEAEKAFIEGEIPVGALAVYNQEVIGLAHNSRNSSGLLLGHAEISALSQAAAFLKDWRLSEVTLYVTLEPCPMCSGVILQSRVKRLVFGAANFREGCAGSVLNLLDYPGMSHHVLISEGVKSSESFALLQRFFRNNRVT